MKYSVTLLLLLAAGKPQRMEHFTFKTKPGEAFELRAEI